MAFGLRNAAATFQKLIAGDVTPGLGHCVKGYIDDLVVFSKDMQSHLLHLRLVLERLRQHDLCAAPEKCYVATQEEDYLGHRISSSGNRPLERHLVQIKNQQAPTNRKELHCLLGVTNWIREYIPGYSTIVAPMTDRDLI